MERGLLVAIDHSKITGSCTNRSASKSAWSIPKGQRFNDWQINPIHKRISHTDHYVLSCFTKKSEKCTFGMTKRWVKPDRESPSPAHYTLASTFRQTQSTSQLSARESQSSIRSLSHLQSAEKKKQLPGPSHYSTSNFTKLASYRQPPKFTIKRAKTTERPSR